MTPLQAHGRRSWPRARLMLIVAALGLVADVAMAQVPQTRPYCDTPEKAIAALKAQFGEVPAAIALDAQDRLISLYVDPDDQSWTVLMTVPGPNAISCVLTGGESWEAIALPPVGDPA
jgi:hypothetical protein